MLVVRFNIETVHIRIPVALLFHHCRKDRKVKANSDIEEACKIFPIT